MGCSNTNVETNNDNKIISLKENNQFQNPDDPPISVRNNNNLSSDDDNDNKLPSKKIKTTRRPPISIKSEVVLASHQHMFSNINENKSERNMSNFNRKNHGKRRTTVLQKSEMNGVVIVENLKEYLPQNITKDTIVKMVEDALGGCIVSDESKVVKGKTVSKNQVNAIAEIVYLRLQDDENKNNLEKNNNESISSDNECEIKDDVRYSCINNLNVTVGLKDLNKALLQQMYFKGKKTNLTKEQMENQMEEMLKENEGVKVLTIELH